MGYTDVFIQQPAKSSGFMKPADMIGHRVCVFGTHEITEQPDTLNEGKMRKVARIDYVDLDDGQGGVIRWNALVDKPGVVNKLTNQTGAILGRIVLGEAKKGQSAPFILDDHQPADAEFFNNVWLPANRDALAGKGSQPAAQQQQSQQQPQQAQQPVQPQQLAGQPNHFAQQQYQQPQQPQAQQQYAQPQAAAAPIPGMPAGMTPEAQAAFAAMVARGEIKLPAQ